MQSGASSPRGATVVAQPPGERALVWIGFPLVGAGAGWLLKSVAGWVASLPWAPFQGPFRLIASVADRPLATIGALVVGGVAGLVVAFLAENDYVSVTVGDEQVTLARGGSSRDVPRGSIESAFLDGKHLVLLGHATEELAREGGDLPDATRLEDAFLAHAYPWHPAGDPYKDQYRRWVEDTPDLPGGANALLRARARALGKGDKDDAAELRAEVSKLGVVVRDENNRQYWRRTGQPPEGPAPPR
ncbi:MAG: hypothetical protein GEV03_26755 [Streptosporangiales bacterium]|nr:hypothetical protein [Streptosporangiales bacterium]